MTGTRCFFSFLLDPGVPLGLPLLVLCHHGRILKSCPDGRQHGPGHDLDPLLRYSRNVNYWLPKIPAIVFGVWLVFHGIASVVLLAQNRRAAFIIPLGGIAAQEARLELLVSIWSTCCRPHPLPASPVPRKTLKYRRLILFFTLFGSILPSLPVVVKIPGI